MAVSCIVNYEFLSERIGKRGLRLRLLAYQAKFLEEGLLASGIERSATQTAIRQLEVDSLQSIGDRDHWVDPGNFNYSSSSYAPARRFVERIRQIKPSQRLLLESPPDGCGAGEVAVKVLTSPPGGTVFFIEVFEYRVCEVHGTGIGEDVGRCDRWFVAPATGLVPVSGRYRYKIRWPGTPESPSRLYDFSGITRDSTITLR